MKKGQSQLLWCQCAHDNLNERIGAVERWKPGLLARKQQIRQDIAHEPTQQSAGHHLEIDIGDDLLLPGCSEQCGDDGETALGDGREKQGAELREARRFGETILYVKVMLKNEVCTVAVFFG